MARLAGRLHITPTKTTSVRPHVFSAANCDSQRGSGARDAVRASNHTLGVLTDWANCLGSSLASGTVTTTTPVLFAWQWQGLGGNECTLVLSLYLH